MSTSEPEPAVSGTGPRAEPVDPWRLGLVSAALALPMLGLALLIARPELDVRWQHQPAHFWIVLAAGAVNAVLAYATGSAARLRGDARVFLVSLAFLSAAGFLGLHALATPGVLLPTTNAGFALATPVGLLVASGFAAASSLDLSEAQARAVTTRGPWLLWALVVLMLSWGVVSLASLGPFHHNHAVEQASGPLIVLSILGVSLYAVAVVRYLRLPRHAASSLPSPWLARSPCSPKPRSRSPGGGTGTPPGGSGTS